MIPGNSSLDGYLSASTSKHEPCVKMPCCRLFTDEVLDKDKTLIHISYELLNMTTSQSLVKSKGKFQQIVYRYSTIEEP